MNKGLFISWIKKSDFLNQHIHFLYLFLDYYHIFFPKKTYAQNNEDVIANILLGRIRSFIDIGASDGYLFSNTYLFAQMKAKGLCFEPNPIAYKRLSFLHKRRHKKIICIQEGISDKEKTSQIELQGQLSFIPETQDISFKKIYSNYYSNQKIIAPIHVKPLNYWFTQFPSFFQTDLVSIDVEGHELSVLKGINFSKAKIKLFVIETKGITEKGPYRHRDYNRIYSLLQKHNYILIFENLSNSFWLEKSLINPKAIDSILQKFPDYKKGVRPY